jgi:hypothetical protein
MKKEFTLEDATKGLVLDKHTLDDTIEEHSLLFDKVAEMAANSASLRDELKRRMEEVYAKRARYYRSTTTQERVTEGRIAEATELDPEYMKVKDQYYAEKENAALWQAKKESYSQRSHMIRDLCDLYSAGYFAGTVVQNTKGAKEVSHEANRLRLKMARRGREERDE